jgi:hypothetical protein
LISKAARLKPGSFFCANEWSQKGFNVNVESQCESKMIDIMRLPVGLKISKQSPFEGGKRTE